eukprot:SAG31_NODE_4050_length_3637_cov_1.854155_1_plen_122_part_10
MMQDLVSKMNQKIFSSFHNKGFGNVRVITVSVILVKQNIGNFVNSHDAQETCNAESGDESPPGRQALSSRARGAGLSSSLFVFFLRFRWYGATGDFTFCTSTSVITGSPMFRRYTGFSFFQ